jgi:hypothetical protein
MFFQAPQDNFVAAFKAVQHLVEHASGRHLFSRPVHAMRYGR